MVLQIVGYFAQGLLCLIYMPLCFQLARYTSEAASRVYADLTKDIDAGEVPDISSHPVPAVSTVFYNLPVRSCRSSVRKQLLHVLQCAVSSCLGSMAGCNAEYQSTWIVLFQYTGLHRFLVRCLQENATMRLVCQCIKADDVFHACWEDSAAKDHHNATGRMYKMSNGLTH